MNANELADKLQELDSKLHLIDLFKAATMLRQQQAEIETLKNHGYRTHYELLRIEYSALKSGVEKILEGCQNVKNENDIPDDTKKIASLIIRDCNQALGKIKND